MTSANTRRVMRKGEQEMKTNHNKLWAINVKFGSRDDGNNGSRWWL